MGCRRPPPLPTSNCMPSLKESGNDLYYNYVPIYHEYKPLWKQFLIWWSCLSMVARCKCDSDFRSEIIARVPIFGVS